MIYTETTIGISLGVRPEYQNFPQDVLEKCKAAYLKQLSHHQIYTYHILLTSD